jgi:hypothetical protein
MYIFRAPQTLFCSVPTVHIRIRINFKLRVRLRIGMQIGLEVFKLLLTILRKKVNTIFSIFSFLFSWGFNISK